MVRAEPGPGPRLTVHLDADTFKTVVSNTPLISIDLVIENSRNELLLGLRNNRPAKDYWFVPGGRIRKGESLDAAFTRITQAELGRIFSRTDARMLGAFEHFYDDSVFGESPGTHYAAWSSMR